MTGTKLWGIGIAILNVMYSFAYLGTSIGDLYTADENGKTFASFYVCQLVEQLSSTSSRYTAMGVDWCLHLQRGSEHVSLSTHAQERSYSHSALALFHLYALSISAVWY